MIAHRTFVDCDKCYAHLRFNTTIDAEAARRLAAEQGWTYADVRGAMVDLCPACRITYMRHTSHVKREAAS
jgi:hypothetical protein